MSPWIVRGLLLATPVLLLATVLCGLAIEIFASRSGRQTSSIWFMAAWGAGLCVATPFYSPYPRLILPLLISLWLGAGLMVQKIIDGDALRSGAGCARFVSSLRFEFCVPLVMVCMIAIRCQIGSFHAWQDRSQFAADIQKLVGKIKDRTAASGYSRDEAIVFVVGHPPTFFAFKGEGLSLVAPIQHWVLAERQNHPTFVAYVDSRVVVSGRDAKLVVGSTVSSIPSHFVVMDEPDCFERMKFNCVWVEMLP